MLRLIWVNVVALNYAFGSNLPHALPDPSGLYCNEAKVRDAATHRRVLNPRYGDP